MEIFPVLLLGIVLIAGCTASQVDLYLKAAPAIQDFLSQYPNAKISTSLIGQGAVVAQIEEIKKECENFQVGNYYKTTISDENSATKLTVWMDAKTYQVVCAVKESEGVKQIIPQGTTTPQTIAPTTYIQPTTTEPTTTSSTTTSSTTTSSSTTSSSTTTSSTTTSSTTTTMATTTTAGCTSNSACGYKQICSNKKCVDVQCTTDSQCSGCKRCSGNSCVSCGSGPYGCYC